MAGVSRLSSAAARIGRGQPLEKSSLGEAPQGKGNKASLTQKLFEDGNAIRKAAINKQGTLEEAIPVVERITDKIPSMSGMSLAQLLHLEKDAQRAVDLAIDEDLDDLTERQRELAAVQDAIKVKRTPPTPVETPASATPREEKSNKGAMYKDQLSESQQKELQRVLDTCVQNEDGSYDCVGDVDLSELGLPVIPVRFNRVEGSFLIYKNNLKSLENTPRYVGQFFDCSQNIELENLVGGPEFVGQDYICHSCELQSLEGCCERVGGSIDCSHNELENLRGGPLVLGADGSYLASENFLGTLRRCPRLIPGDFDVAYNSLEDFASGPRIVKGSLLAHGNNINSFKGAPREVGGDLELTDNDLTDEQINAYKEKLGKE